MRDPDLPALLGGAKAVTPGEREAHRHPRIGAEEEAAVLEVLRSGELSNHPVTRRLEDDYRRLTGARYALAHCNGTAGLLAAFFAIGLRPGDEVIVPSATFWASVVPLLWVGAVPVFAESEPERLGLDPADVERRITPRTRALVVVHLFGMPSRMGPLRALAEKHGLKIVEDASHAPGAAWRGRPCGALGDVSVFSLQTNKPAPAGEGGMLLTDDEGIYETAVCLGDMVRIPELGPGPRRFAGTTFGIKTRIAPLSAAVARVQLRHLPERSRRRGENIGYLSARLERLGFDTFRPPPHVERVHYEFVIRRRPGRVPLSPETLVEALRAEGCAVTQPRYPLLHQQPLFTEGEYKRILRPDAKSFGTLPEYRPDALPRTGAAAAELIRLPVFPFAERELLDQYARAFEKVVAHAAEIGARAARRDGAERAAGEAV